MSDGITRICREHDMELRQLGAHFVCPYGHTCDTEWYVKPPTAKTGPSLPAPVVQLTAPTVEPKPRPRRKSVMPREKVEHPHGTRQRYWRGCKCQPCKSALAKYQRERKAEKEGGPVSERKKPARRTGPGPKASKVVRAKRALRIEDALAAEASPHDLGRLASAILNLREQLGAAEAEFRTKANSFFPGWSFIPAES